MIERVIDVEAGPFTLLKDRQQCRPAGVDQPSKLVLRNLLECFGMALFQGSLHFACGDPIRMA